MFYLYIILEKSKTVRTECLSVVARSVREGVDCKGLGRMCVHDGLFMSSQTWWLHHYRHLSQPAEQYTKKGGFYCYLRYTLIRIVSGGGGEWHGCGHLGDSNPQCVWEMESV